MIQSRARAAVLLLAVFGVGVGVGALGHDQWHRAEMAERRGPDAYLRRLTAELTLTAEQQAQVKAVLDRFTPQMEAVAAETRPKYEAMRTQIRAEIRTLLTDAQRTRYEEMIRRHDADRSARQSRGRS